MARMRYKLRMMREAHVSACAGEQATWHDEPPTPSSAMGSAVSGVSGFDDSALWVRLPGCAQCE